MPSARITFGRALTTIALIVAMSAIGFAHKTDRTGPSEELAAYVAAGGSISDICGDTGRPDHSAGMGCEACRIVDTAHRPRDAKAIPVAMLAQTRTFGFVAKRAHHRQRLDPARLTRAPPPA